MLFALLALVLCAPLAHGALLTEGFEALPEGARLAPAQPQAGWIAPAGEVTAVADPVREGERALRLAAGTAEHARELPAGLFELTVWARGEGAFTLAVRGAAQGGRAFTLFDEWAEYSLLFEVPEAGEVTFHLHMETHGFADDLTVTVATPEQQQAWDRARADFAALGWMPVSPQKPAPTPHDLRPQGLREPSPADLEQWRIREKVVYYDPDYEPSWVDDPDQVARFFTLRGFTPLTARDLGEWMRRKTAEGAAGTVVVSAMGTVPSSLLELETLTDLVPEHVTTVAHDSTLLRYLRAGGRVVWFANASMYLWQDETGPWRSIHGRRTALGISDGDRQFFYGSPGPTAITEAGRRWGLRTAWSAVRPVPRSEVTLSFLDDPERDLSDIWLKNFNPDYPLSGFIGIPQYTSPSNTALLEDGYRLALYSGEPVEVPPVPAELEREPEVELTLLPYLSDDFPRYAYLRDERTRVRLRLTNRREQPLEGSGRLSLHLGDDTLGSWNFRLQAPAGEGGQASLPFSFRDLKVAEYTLRAELQIGDEAHRAEAPLWVCPPPDPDGIYFALWGPNPRIAYRRDNYLEQLRELGMTGAMVADPTPAFLDSALWHGLPVTVRLHGGEGPNFSSPVPEEELYRLNASGEPFPNPWAGGRRTLTGIAHLDWQKAIARDLGEQVAALAPYPGFYPVVCTNDDFSARAGLDYNEWNVRRFREKYGMDPPRPPEALEADNVSTLARDPGLLPDDDPWVLWQRFLCEDVHGGFNHLLTQAVLGATQGQGRIGPIPGGMQIPLVNFWSAQWPPYNFGPEGFNLIFSYNYNYYWVPALGQVWWYELGRMGNRDLDQWLMPDSMHDRLSYHLHNWYLFMAAGLDGLAYFIYDQTSEPFREAARQVGPLSRDYGKLLRRLEPAPRTVGLLMPFEQCAHRVSWHIEMNYAFANLAMGHAEVEPVWPEELPDRMGQYRVLVLADVDFLTESNARLLQEYMAQGGVVLCDSATGVDLPGAQRLEFPLHEAARRAAYGNLEHIARAQAAVEEHVRPWARADDPHLFLRRYQLEGVDYLWCVHLMNQEQDLANNQWISPGADLDAIEAEAGFGVRDYEGTVTVPAGDFVVYDVLTGRRLPTTPRGDRLEVPVRMGLWQGALLAFYPAAPDRLTLQAPAQAQTGQAITLTARVQAGGQPFPGNLPLVITVTEPGGAASREYSHTALATGGEYQWEMPLARNDRPGAWRVTVRELSAGLETSARLEVRR